jgi:phosphoglycolate phosphatase (TIGR01487 family)
MPEESGAPSVRFTEANPVGGLRFATRNCKLPFAGCPRQRAEARDRGAACAVLNFDYVSPEDPMIRYLALASDYDGTLAHDGVVSEETLEAIRRLKVSGRKFILVTGRTLDQVKEVFPEHELCDLIVAENGALLWNPATRAETALAAPPPANFVRELLRRGATPLAEGRVILATWEPKETIVFETIRDLRLEMQVIFNKGAVMILPSGVNKGTGLKAALDLLGLSQHNVVAVGDAENDHTLLKFCEAGVAVNNALPSLKEAADFVTKGDHGGGVTELIEQLLQDDLAGLARKMDRHDLEIGELSDGAKVRLPPYGFSILIAGTSGGGKSTLASTFIERIAQQRYQYCIIDPEGDYAEQEDAVVLGNSQRAPAAKEVMTALSKPKQNCVVNLLGISLAERPPYFEKLFSDLLEMRARTGRPHWLILDETHHIFPFSRENFLGADSSHVPGILMLTVDPEHIAKSILREVDLILAIGKDPGGTFSSFSLAVGESRPEVPAISLGHGEAIAWWRRPLGEPFVFRSYPPSLPRRRHSRKYAEGDVKEASFVFRGPEGKLQLRAQNLVLFVQMGAGVDDETWNYHLSQGDYEKWFREVIKDPELADFAAALGKKPELSAEQSRKAIREKIQERYTAPA